MAQFPRRVFRKCWHAAEQVERTAETAPRRPFLWEGDRQDHLCERVGGEMRVRRRNARTQVRHRSGARCAEAGPCWTYRRQAGDRGNHPGRPGARRGCSSTVRRPWSRARGVDRYGESVHLFRRELAAASRPSNDPSRRGSALSAPRSSKALEARLQAER